MDSERLKKEYFNRRALIGVMVIAIAVILIILLWPKNLSYSECGECEMLGLSENIERITGVEQGPFGLRFTAVVNTYCGQTFTVSNSFENQVLSVSLEMAGENLNNFCVCDREIELRVPFHGEIGKVELLKDNELVDKRSVGETLSSGEEFCGIEGYSEKCYYRLAFQEEDFSYCKNIANGGDCIRELKEAVLVNCVTNRSLEYCENAVFEIN